MHETTNQRFRSAHKVRDAHWSPKLISPTLQALPATPVPYDPYLGQNQVTELDLHVILPIQVLT